jgi:hypothetical protein
VIGVGVYFEFRILYLFGIWCLEFGIYVCRSMDRYMAKSILEHCS